MCRCASSDKKNLTDKSLISCNFFVTLMKRYIVVKELVTRKIQL